MGNILIVMPKQEDANRIASIIQSAGLMYDIEVCASGNDALRISHDRDSGTVICTKRLRDMAYTDLADYLPENFKLIVLTSNLSMDSMSDRVVKLSMPLKRSDLVSTVDMLMGGGYRRRRKKSESASTRNSPPPKRNDAERQIIDKAKQLLMERNGMSEPEAYRYIQKNSMDYGRSMVESAQMIMLINNE